MIRLRPVASDGSGAGAWGAGSVMAGLIPSRCPPDKQEKATLTVLEQAELLWGGRSGVAAASGAARQPLAMGHGVLRRGAFRREFLPPVGKRRSASFRSRQRHISRRHPGRHQAVSAPSFAASGAGVKPQNGFQNWFSSLRAPSEHRIIRA